MGLIIPNITNLGWFELVIVGKLYYVVTQG